MTMAKGPANSMGGPLRGLPPGINPDPDILASLPAQIRTEPEHKPADSGPAATPPAYYSHAPAPLFC